jgi:hypothetical protein
MAYPKIFNQHQESNRFKVQIGTLQYKLEEDIVRIGLLRTIVISTPVPLIFSAIKIEKLSASGSSL